MLQAFVVPLKVIGYVQVLDVWKLLRHILSNYLFVIRHTVEILDIK
jgi:hypothetical protein